MATIRAARLDDASAIARVHVDTWRSTYAGIVPDDFLEKLSYEKRAAMWRDIIQRATAREHVIVAVDSDDNIVGFSAGGPSRTPEYPFEGELYAIYLLQKRQGQGIGRRLVQATIDRLSLDGFRSMMVWVLADNPTYRFYLEMGGVACGEKLEVIGDKSLKEIACGWSVLPTTKAAIRTKELEPSLWPALEQFFLSEK